MMKKIYIFLIVLLIPLALFGQLSGDGTYSNPFSGTLEPIDTEATDYPDTTWAGTVYINGDVTIDDEELMISSGTNIIFVAENADLIITGTGQLTADGTSSSKITFTADHDDDDIYGEDAADNDAGDWDERWGHILFQSMGSADASIIDYCIIEYGDVSGPTNDVKYFGGGIHTNFSDLTVSNCIIRNNKARFGGGVSVDKGQSPNIYKTYFINNEATHGGGGIFCWDNTASTIENCIFENNKAGYGTIVTYYSGGGVQLLTNTSSQSDQVINCTFVNNDSNHDGDGLHFYGVGTKKAINCIFWGSNVQIKNGSSLNLTNCAIQGSTTGTNTITLNSSNTGTNPYGPYFNATDGTDWSIKVISPCRDAGTNTGAPATDFDGNSRVGTTDIGAYEVQYNRWKTTGSNDVWNNSANWEQGIPGASQNIVIPTGADYYPTSSSSQNYTITAGFGMVLDPGAQATFGTLATTGDLRLRSDASNISSLIINNIDATAIVDIYLTGGGTSTTYRWHYISSPFYTKPSITPFTAVTYNLAQFHQELYKSSNQGWIAYDGYIYPGPGTGGEQFNVLWPRRGYNFYDNVNNEITISGQLTYTNVDTTLGYGDNGESWSGFNLLGNPFPSGLDWDDIIAGTYYTYPSNTSKGLYFTRNNVQCSYIGGVGTPSDVSGIIPPMQGFFVKTYSKEKIIRLHASARTHNSIHARYKGKSEIPLVRLSLTKDSISDETVVRFDEQAKLELDYDFDALKMFLSDNNISIYSFTGETKYAINGLPFPEDSMNISLAINSPKSDTLKITATQIQGLEDYGLILKDLYQDFDINLNEVTEYIFNADSGTAIDRFILTVYNNVTGLPDIINPEPEKAFNIYSSHGIIFINPAKDVWNGRRSDLRIYDITGKIVMQQNNIEWQKGVTKEISLNVAQGIYLVEICSGTERFVGKVSVLR